MEACPDLHLEEGYHTGLAAITARATLKDATIPPVTAHSDDKARLSDCSELFPGPSEASRGELFDSSRPEPEKLADGFTCDQATTRGRSISQTSAAEPGCKKSARGVATDSKSRTAPALGNAAAARGFSERRNADAANAAPKVTPLQVAMRAHQPNLLAVHIVDRNPLKRLPLLEVSTHMLLWRFLPCGFYLLRFEKAPDTSVVRITRTYDIICFCCVRDTVMPRTPAPRLSKQHFWDWYRLVRDAVLCLVLGFFLHLVPAVAIGIEVVLGSKDNASLFSLAWLGCWISSFLLVQFLRPWGIVVGAGGCACAPCGGAKFIPFSSYAHAKATCEYWEHAYTKQRTRGFEPAERVSFCTWRLGAGLVVMIVLLANAVYFATLVSDCVERGCCSGDDATLDACRDTGYPQ